MRKRRTRSHIIADLSVNHVERFVLRCGYTVERVQHDYGIDLLLYTYNAHGELENDVVNIQVKATDHLPLLQDGQTIPLLVERADLEHWLQETMPVILIVYDAQADIAYWLYVQAYFEALPDFRLAEVGETVTVHLKRAQIVNEDTVRTFASYKDNVLRQIRGVVRHE
ncbi:MAG TPA: DUF4365 domain-containing protein [Chthonomonadaceae bacterium]|nr:DUF4365 domain-containing protein [Chthonomonadaceae bacterium]